MWVGTVMIEWLWGEFLADLSGIAIGAIIFGVVAVIAGVREWWKRLRS